MASDWDHTEELRPPALFTDRDRELLCDWLRACGFDPEDCAASARIVIDWSRRRVSVDVAPFTKSGAQIFDPSDYTVQCVQQTREVLVIPPLPELEFYTYQRDSKP